MTNAARRIWDTHFGDPAAAHALALQALAPASLPDEPTRAWCELTVAYHHLFFTPHPVEARAGLAQARARFEKVGDAGGATLAQTGLARILLIEQQPLAAREMLEPLYAIALSMPPQDRFWVVNALGATYFYTDRMDEAIRYLYEALEALRTIDPSPQLPTVMSNLAAALVTVGDFEPARELARDALELLPRYNNPQLMLFARSNLAEALLGVGERDAALAIVDTIFPGDEPPSARAAQAHYCAIGAETYAQAGRLDDAQRCVDTARAIHAEYPGGFNDVHWRWANAALAAARDVDGDAALAALEAAADAAKAAHHLPTLCKAHALAAQRHAARGRFEQAYAHQQQLLDAQTERLSSRASARYYLLKVQHELTHARVDRDRAERQRQESDSLNRELERLNRELITRMREIEQLQAQLATEAVHDPLTQLFNRRYLDSTMPGLLAGAARRDAPLAVALVDLDHFKRVNDRFGHPAGDSVLVHVARLFGTALRPADVVARYGGEEFCIVLPDTDGNGALAALGSLAQRLGLLALDVDGEPLGRLTFSAGVAVFSSDGDTVAELIAAADRALYAAKRAGRDRIVLAVPRAVRAA